MCVCACVCVVRGVCVKWQTAEPKMAFNFAHLLSAACGGAPHRLRRLRRPWARCPHAPAVVFGLPGGRARLDLYRISTLVAKLRNRKWRLILRTCCPPPAAALRAAWGACGAPVAVCAGGGIPRRYATPRLYGVLGPGGGHDYAVEASTSERVASVFTKMGVPSPASIRSGVTVPGALVARSLEWQQRRRPRLSSRRRGAEGWPTGGAVLLQAPPIGQPSDRSIGAQSRFRSEKAAGAAADPSRDASSFLCSPMRREATRRCSARHAR